MLKRILLFLPSSLTVALALLLCLNQRTAHAQTGPRITIESNPSGASVLIDGAAQGITIPGGVKVRVNKGQRRIRLELEGHKPSEQVVNVTVAQKYTFNLEKAPGRLDIKYPTTNELAKGAELYVDGTMAGQVPLQVDVPAGRHLIEVKKSGAKPYSETIEVKAGETKPMWIQLQAESRAGSVLVAADAAEADVFVDGQAKGRAPIVVDNLNEGEHLIEVRRNEAGAPTWKQTVRITANQQVKVMAQTAPAPAQPGSLIVISSNTDAEVVIDGSTKGRVGQPISLPAGQHSVQVLAKGFNSVSRVIIIEAGKPLIEKIDLVGSAEARGVGFVRIVMLSPVPGAQYFVNGRTIDESVALSDSGIEVAAGQVIVSVGREGFGQVKKEITLRSGTTEVVQLDLRNVGKLYIASEPKGALVTLDRKLLGPTPITSGELSIGEHTVEIQKDKYEPIFEKVTIRPGEEEKVSFILKPKAPPPIDKVAIQKSLSSFSAVTMPLQSFTVDLAAGFPYFASGRINVGILKVKDLPGVREMGLDAGVELRTTIYHFEIGGNIRVQLLKIDPFALGIQTYLGGGGGPRFRNSIQWEIGLPMTLLAGNIVKLTAKPYLQVYSDRNCPGTGDIDKVRSRDGVAGIQALGDPDTGAEHTGDRCVGRTYSGTNAPSPIWAAGGYTQGAMMLGSSTYDPMNALYQVDGVGALERFVGVRFLLQAVVEFALSPNLNLWALIEGAPNQRDRHMFTDKFNRIMPINDTPIYGRAGLSLKF